MRDLTPVEIGSLLFSVKGNLELISSTLSKWRSEGVGLSGMVPLTIIASEAKINSTIVDVEDLIQMIAKVSYNVVDRYDKSLCQK
jgi:hypothetical protein